MVLLMVRYDPHFFPLIYSDFCSNFYSRPIRPLSKLALPDKVQGVYGAEDRNVLEVHEDLSTGATQQFDDGVEFRKRSITN
jgi:hypothetical protein